MFTCTAYSQTVTIDYETWNPSNPPCRIFSGNTNVQATGATGGTITHISSIGKPYYNTTDKEIQIQTIYVSAGAGTWNGGSFRIFYNFKNGYSYTIYVTAAAVEKTEGYQTGPYFRLDVDNSIGGLSTNTPCDGPEQVTQNLGGNPAARKLSLDVMQEIQFVMPNLGSQSTLNITAIPAQNGGVKTVRIKKIRIEETPPATSFTLASSTNAIICGSVAPITFNITNVANTPGVTGYTWNLGSTANGWKLSNGTAAPQIIITNALTNTLTLTPTCGAVLSSISATAAIGANNYNTNTSSVSINQPTISISGNDAFCNGSSTYSITNLPCNPSLVWSISPLAGIASLTTSGNSCTLTKTGNGFITLTATINAACLSNSGKFTKIINVGNPQTNYKLTNIQTLTTLCGWDVNLLNLCNASGYIFQDNTALPYTNETGPPQPYNYLVQQNVGNGPITKTYTIAAVNQCGTGNFVTKSIIVPAPWRTGNCSVGARVANSNTLQKDDEIIVYPNPASSVIKITKKGNIGFSSVRILDKSGVIKKRLIFKNNTVSGTIDISNLTIGVYQIQIFVGNTWRSKTFTKL